MLRPRAERVLTATRTAPIQLATLGRDVALTGHGQGQIDGTVKKEAGDRRHACR